MNETSAVLGIQLNKKRMLRDASSLQLPRAAAAIALFDHKTRDEQKMLLQITKHDGTHVLQGPIGNELASNWAALMEQHI